MYIFIKQHILITCSIIIYNRMYNGIGLQTPRGSGTSGYIQANVSLNQKKTHSKEQFLLQLEAKRNAHVAPPRKANPQIVQHQRKRQIMLRSLQLKKKLEAQGHTPQIIQQSLKKAQEILKAQLEKGQIQTRTKDTHVMTQAKQKEYTRLSNAFGLDAQTKKGSAFDFDHMREERLKKLAQKQRGFLCPHEDCGKRYDLKEYLERHLKYKHSKKE